MVKRIFVALFCFSICACTTTQRPVKERTISTTSGIKIETDKVGLDYSLSEFQERNTTNIKDKFWHAYYLMQYNIDDLPNISCYYGIKSKAKDIFLGVLEGQIQVVKDTFLYRFSKEVDTVKYKAISHSSIGLVIRDTRDSEEYGKEKFIKIPKCK